MTLKIENLYFHNIRCLQLAVMASIDVDDSISEIITLCSTIKKVSKYSRKSEYYKF